MSDDESTECGLEAQRGRAVPVAAIETPSAAPETIPRMMPAWSAEVFDV